MKQTAVGIFLWRYQENFRNYPGYHLTADKSGCETLSRVFESLARTQKRLELQIKLSAVTDKILAVPNNRAGNETVLSFQSWQVASEPGLENEYFMFGERPPICRLVLSAKKAEAVVSGVKDIAAGRGDYSIGGKLQQVLWFWWYPSTPNPALQRTPLKRPR